MELFPFINSFFTKNGEFQSTTQVERGRHFFMINRFCSIKYPVQASYFNHIKIHPGQAVTFWQELLSRTYNRTPNWMYTKTKSEKEKIKRAQPVTDEVIRVYCEKMQISRRDFNDWTGMFGDSAWDEVKEFQKLIEQ
jgi:hypothetical protein